MNTVLNPKNILITLNDVQNIFKKASLDAQPKNIRYYIQAMTHKSYAQKNSEMVSYDHKIVPLQKYSQEPYEFVGDSIVNKSVCQYLYRRYPFCNEGQFTKMKHRIVDTATLSSFGRFYGFQKYCLISCIAEQTAGRDADKLMEDSFEAFVFAICLDIGEKNASMFVTNTLEQLIDFSQLQAEDINYKQQLQQVFHKIWHLTPTYEIVSERGMNHKKTFKIVVLDIFGLPIGYGLAALKQDAEQKACKKALEFIENVQNKLNDHPVYDVEFMYQIPNQLNALIDKLDLPQAQLEIISTIVQQTNAYFVEYRVNGETRKYTMNYKPHEYKYYQRLFDDIDSMKRYLSVYEELKNTIN